MARKHSAAMLWFPIGVFSGTTAFANAGDLFQAEAPLLELLAIGLAATASLFTLFSRDWLQRIHSVLARLGWEASSLGAPARPEGARSFGKSRFPAEIPGAFDDAADISSAIEAHPLRLRDCDPDRWDSFAQHCDSSYRSAHHWLRAWSRKGFLRHEMKLLELFRAGRKIGQCAVGIGAREGLFLDRLQIDPACRDLWSDAMAAVLAELGPRRYVYGWDLNLEASREDDLRTIAGVTVETVCPLTVHAVDFGQWASWSEYWKSTSSNTQRNAKRAEKENVDVVVRQGIASLTHVPAITRLRSAMYQRKGLDFGPAKVLASYVATHVTCRRYSLTAIAYDGATPLAGFSGMEFGPNTYYIDGGSLPANKGAAWLIQMVMLKRAWERSSGRGKFIMGYVDYATHDDAIGGGLIRSRKAVKASDYPTSIVTFAFDKARSSDQPRASAELPGAEISVQ